MKILLRAKASSGLATKMRRAAGQKQFCFSVVATAVDGQKDRDGRSPRLLVVIS